MRLISTHPWTDVSIAAEGRATEGSFSWMCWGQRQSRRKRSNQSEFVRNVGRHPFGSGGAHLEGECRHPWKWRSGWKATLGNVLASLRRCHTWKALRDKKNKPIGDKHYPRSWDLTWGFGWCWRRVVVKKKYNGDRWCWGVQDEKRGRRDLSQAWPAGHRLWMGLPDIVWMGMAGHRLWMGRASRALVLRNSLGTSRSLPAPWSTKENLCRSWF